MSVKNRQALIFGGLGGIGSCLVRTLLAENVAKLAIVDLPETNSSEFAENEKINYFQCNIGDENEIRKTFEIIWSDLKGFDLIINSAGILDELNPENCFRINTVSNFSVFSS